VFYIVGLEMKLLSSLKNPNHQQTIVVLIKAGKAAFITEICRPPRE